MVPQSVLLELEKQKAKLAMDQQKEKTNSSKVKSPVKRKLKKFTNRSSREGDKKRKKFMSDDFGEDEKEQLKKVDKKERKKCVITWRKKKKNIKKKRIIKEKFEFRRKVIRLRESKYQTDIYNNALLVNQVGYVKAVTIL